MLASIATVSLSGPLDRKLEAIAAAGFDGVEIFENDLVVHPARPAEIRKMIDALGLVCTAFQPFRDLEGMPEATRQHVFDRLERKFDLMEELGADFLLVCSNVSPHSLGDADRIAADLHEAGERAARRGFRIGYEALAWGRHVNDHRDAWAMVRLADHKAVGLVLDSFHSLARRIPSASIATIDPAKIFLVQVADAPLLRMDELAWSRHFRNMPGQGDLPVIDYVAALEAIGYQGPLSLEIFNDRFRAGSAREIALDGRRSLLVLGDRVGRRRGAPSLPDRVRVEGVEFIEFAANVEEAEQLGGLFAALGFACVGRHQVKAVSVWQQGEMRLVINAEPVGFAHSYDLVHGASVCAIGLRVADAGAALERARALAIPVFEANAAEIRHSFPAVRGVGGSLIYMVDASLAESVWDAEFEPLPAEPTQVGLNRVDHVAQVMFYDEMLTWVLFYASLFEVDRTMPSEFTDPSGLVESQALESADGKVRLVLNTSAAPQTLARRFLDHHYGSGVQSVALGTEDIFEAASAIREAGLPVLAIPSNYYDDLAARLALDEAFVERLRALDLLYDRDASGDYFQLYTRAFEKRFFFELVQRRDYSGYGAVNQPVRLAAQARFVDQFVD
ncbi:bifunctional sugar phosphate isomerase/epimerase/4-hydroxyphenylpyruvate dioxygenase family protein [Sphingosinicella terrae]|uniref:bifunctional sugar phosphate isomerase/epimerase/4-hydroxyphenylpyruvate dioxygenase family protein n=1 Tax=Sphingosinicella terrae TaxID=2172047 RepID=UPI000E0D6B91|nr:sugar phosphate isomerase/epimerase and 4-hydroxyphenylpyruvate domain-containing protein [Sphingosinicella terrae]